MTVNTGKYDNILPAPVAPVVSLVGQLSVSTAIAFTPGSDFTSSIAVGDTLVVAASTVGQSSQSISGGNVTNWEIISAGGSTNSLAAIYVGQVASLAGSWNITIAAQPGDTTSASAATLTHWSGLAPFDTYNTLCSLVDQDGASYATSGSTSGFPFLMPSTGGQVLIAVGASEGTLGTSINSGWTTFSGFSSGTSYTGGYAIQPSRKAPITSGSYGWNATLGSGQGAAVAAVTLRPNATPLRLNNIYGNAQYYQVFNGNGKIVSQGAMPDIPTITHISDVSGKTTTGTLTLTPSTSPAINDTLIVTVCGGVAGGSGKASITGGGVANWTTINNFGGATTNAVFVGAVTTPGAAAVTITNTVTTGNMIGTVAHWTGVNPDTPLDQTGNSGTADSPASAAVGPSLAAPMVAGELTVAIASSAGLVGSPLTGPPLLTELASSTAYKATSGDGNTTTGYYVNPGTGAVGNAYGWTVAGGNGYTWVTGTTFTPANATNIAIPPPNGMAWEPGYHVVSFSAVIPNGSPLVFTGATAATGSNQVSLAGGWTGATGGMGLYGVDWADGALVVGVSGPTLTVNATPHLIKANPYPITLGWCVDGTQVHFFRSVPGVGLPGVTGLPPHGFASEPSGLVSGNGYDPIMHGLLAMGPTRYSIADGTDPTSPSPVEQPYGTGGNIQSVQSLVLTDLGITGPSGFFGNYRAPAYQDVARPRPQFANFPNNVIATYSNPPGPSTGWTAYVAGVTTTVASLGPSSLWSRNGQTGPYGIRYYEGMNEPDAEKSVGPTSLAFAYLTLRTAMKAADSTALALGPGYVEGGPTGASNNSAPYVSEVDQFLKNVAQQGGQVDAVSMHFYGGWQGSLIGTSTWWKSLVACLNQNGYSVVPSGQESPGAVSVWISEAGEIKLGSFGDQGLFMNDPRRAVTWLCTLLLSGEANGIPKEQICFYQDSNIADPYASWIRDPDQSLRAEATTYRVLSEELWGKQFQSLLNFGPLGNNLYYGGVFGPANGSGAGGLVILYAEGMYADTATLTGVGPGPITYSDWRGVVTTVTGTGGSNFVIPISNTPVYVRIPAATTTTVRVATAGGGIFNALNLASSAGATGSGNTNPTIAPVSTINDGAFYTGGYAPGRSGPTAVNGVTGPDFTYQTTTPGYVELDWGSAQNISRVTVKQVSPWAEDNPGGNGYNAQWLNWTAGSNVITALFDSMPDVAVGQLVNAKTTDFPADTRVLSINHATKTIVVSNNALTTVASSFPTPDYNIVFTPLNGFSVMLTGSLQYWDGSSWVGCPTIPDSHWDNQGNYSNPSVPLTISGCTWTNNSNVITTTNGFTQVATGTLINLSAFPAGTYVYSVDSSGQITASAPAIASGTGSVTFLPQTNIPGPIGHSVGIPNTSFGNQLWTSFYDFNWVVNVGFSQSISTTKLRLNISSTTYGHVADATMANFLDGDGLPSINISEIAVFGTNVPVQIFGPFHA